MPEYDDTNKGAVWKNDKRMTDRHPHYKGSINVEGKDYWLSVWKNNSDNPKAPLLKFSVEAKEQQHSQGVQQARQELDDELPDVPVGGGGGSNFQPDEDIPFARHDDWPW